MKNSQLFFSNSFHPTAFPKSHEIATYSLDIPKFSVTELADTPALSVRRS
jgi:hypothetical protein